MKFAALSLAACAALGLSVGTASAQFPAYGAPLYGGPIYGGSLYTPGYSGFGLSINRPGLSFSLGTGGVYPLYNYGGLYSRPYYGGYGGYRSYYGGYGGYYGHHHGGYHGHHGRHW
jgi:hypothetical protein